MYGVQNKVTSKQFLAGAASAAVHRSTRIMLAALKFFLGQDEDNGADSDDEEEEGPKLAQPSKAEVYKATKKAFCRFSLCQALAAVLIDVLRLWSAFEEEGIHQEGTYRCLSETIEKCCGAYLRYPALVTQETSMTVQGTAASKKKKEKKLQRVMAAVKKQKRKASHNHENFAAIQLLHDPQVRQLVPVKTEQSDKADPGSILH